MAIFTNQATLTYNNTSTNSNVATGTLLEVLSATKTSLSGEYAVNDRVTYVISILNSGAAPFTGLTVTDDLGMYTVDENDYYPLTYVEGSLQYYVNGILQTTPTVTSGPPLTVGGISVPAGGNAILVYEATVNSYAPLGTGGTIENEAQITGGGLSIPVTASATISANSAPYLTISKSICPSSITENSRVTYTFIIQNLGNTEAVVTDNISVTDIFDPILTDISVSLNGNILSSPDGYTYDETTGTFVTTPGIITVPAATYTQDPTTGQWTATPGTAVLTVTGTI
ncbi:MAG: hypothetical protein E7665_05115 [Ruminococcaceae bacterium]|nr:hypothetical protein [Oscillospiraceae bacterium]